jgi:hypothetical protein
VNTTGAAGETAAEGGAESRWRWGRPRPRPPRSAAPAPAACQGRAACRRPAARRGPGERRAPGVRRGWVARRAREGPDWMCLPVGRPQEAPESRGSRRRASVPLDRSPGPRRPATRPPARAPDRGPAGPGRPERASQPVRRLLAAASAASWAYRRGRGRLSHRAGEESSIGGSRSLRRAECPSCLFAPPDPPPTSLWLRSLSLDRPPLSLDATRGATSSLAQRRPARQHQRGGSSGGSAGARRSGTTPAPSAGAERPGSVVPGAERRRRRRLITVARLPSGSKVCRAVW